MKDNALWVVRIDLGATIIVDAICLSLVLCYILLGNLLRWITTISRYDLDDLVGGECSNASCCSCRMIFLHLLGLSLCATL